MEGGGASKEQMYGVRLSLFSRSTITYLTGKMILFIKLAGRGGRPFIVYLKLHPKNVLINVPRIATFVFFSYRMNN